MQQPVTIIDVAKAAGVSPSTVSHTLNGKRPVSDATQRRVLEAIETLGYVPSWNASRLKQNASGIIGVLAADITETFVNQIVRGIEYGLSGGDYSLFFVSGLEFGNDLKRAYNFLKSHQVDGILFCHHIPLWKEFNLDPKRSDIPIISLNMQSADMISVVIDNETGGRQAAEHLYSCTMGHPAIICGPEDRLSTIDRLSGFSQRISELQLTLPDDPYYGAYDFEHGFEAATHLMDTHPETDSIFCANDYIAAGAISAVIKSGRSIPEEVRVIGFDNRDFTAFWPIPISTFEQPLQQIGILGASILKQVIHTGTYTPTTHVLQSRLIPRASTIRH